MAAHDAASGALGRLSERIESCRSCSRLVAWREQVGAQPRRAYQDHAYWARPLAGWGDPAATLVVVGLAPAAHGGNRTGRMFTGDRSGDWLYGAMWRAGYANQPTSTSRDDGLTLINAWVTAAVRCAPPDNKPTPSERDACAPYLAEELGLLRNAKVFVALGQFALNALASVLHVSPRPRFGHLAEHHLADDRVILSSYHPSQRNTFTGTLTEPMFDAVFSRARALGA
jgi:uracil-DNA glycosylase